MTTYREYAPSLYHDGDAELDCFRERVDVGEQCPSCYTRHGIVAKVDIVGARYFSCQACKAEWADVWDNSNA